MGKRERRGEEMGEKGEGKRWERERGGREK